MCMPLTRASMRIVWTESHTRKISGAGVSLLWAWGIGAQSLPIPQQKGCRVSPAGGLGVSPNYLPCPYAWGAGASLPGAWTPILSLFPNTWGCRVSLLGVWGIGAQLSLVPKKGV